MSSPEQKLADLGYTLPKPIAPVANYVNYVLSGKLLFISGQISKVGDEHIKGTSRKRFDG